MRQTATGLLSPAAAEARVAGGRGCNKHCAAGPRDDTLHGAHRSCRRAQQHSIVRCQYGRRPLTGPPCQQHTPARTRMCALYQQATAYTTAFHHSAGVHAGGPVLLPAALDAQRLPVCGPPHHDGDLHDVQRGACGALVSPQLFRICWDGPRSSIIPRRFARSKHVHSVLDPVSDP